MRRPTDKKSKRQSRLEHTIAETGYTVPTGSNSNSGYSSGYDKSATGGYQKPQRRDRYEPGKPNRGSDDGIPL
jgi:hypothetical protein